MNIEYSTILITSAGNFMGRAIACHFSSLGASVIITDSERNNLNETYRLCQQLNADVVSYELKDQSAVSISDLFNTIEKECSNGIDALINNYADVSLPSLFSHQQNCSPSQLIELPESLFSYGQFAAQHMRRCNKKGIIINLGHYNFSSQKPDPVHSTTLLAGLTKSWAKELNPFNIRVGGVTPCFASLTSESNVHLLYQELIKNTEYILENDYFNGRIIEATP